MAAGRDVVVEGGGMGRPPGSNQTNPAPGYPPGFILLSFAGLVLTPKLFLSSPHAGCRHPLWAVGGESEGGRKESQHENNARAPFADWAIGPV